MPAFAGLSASVMSLCQRGESPRRVRSRHMKPKATASPGGGVGSSRRRRGSPQDDEPDSAGWRGEPAHAWRSLGSKDPTGRAEVTGKATFGRTTWLGAGCPEGRADKRRDLPGLRERGRSQSPHSTAVAQAARGADSKAAPREGGAGRWMREAHNGASHSTGSAREG